LVVEGLEAVACSDGAVDEGFDGGGAVEGDALGSVEGVAEKEGGIGGLWVDVEGEGAVAYADDDGLDVGIVGVGEASEEVAVG